jgi:hypothetical protein
MRDVDLLRDPEFGLIILWLAFGIVLGRLCREGACTQSLSLTRHWMLNPEVRWTGLVTPTPPSERSVPAFMPPLFR